MIHNMRNEIIGNSNNNVGATCENLFIHIFSCGQWLRKQILQNIHNMKLRESGLIYEAVKASPLCGESS